MSGKELSCRQVTLVLTGQGGTTNLIPASVLALKKIEQCTNAILSTDAKVYTATPNYAGTAILLVDLTQATDASRIPADVTGTIRLVVKGYL